METEVRSLETKKVDTKKVLITLSLVLLTASLVGGGTYYILNKNFTAEREANEKALAEINDKVVELSEKKEAVSENTPATATVADWKTYSNSSYGFSVQYAPGNYYEVREDDNALNVLFIEDKYKGSEMGVASTVAVTAYPRKGSGLLNWLKSDQSISGTLSGEFTPVSIAGFSGYSFITQGMGGDSQNYAIEANSTVYIFSGLKTGAGFEVNKFANSFKVL